MCRCSLIRSKYLSIIAITVVTAILYVILSTSDEKLDIHDRHIENSLRNSVRKYKGTGCIIPKLDPYDKEILPYLDSDVPRIECKGFDWVRCHHSTCKVRNEIFERVDAVECIYNEIIHICDVKYIIGPNVSVKNEDKYRLKRSDHVKVSCVGRSKRLHVLRKWSGFAVGFRPVAVPKTTRNFSILVVGIDSTSRSAFIRNLPKSYTVLNELKAVVMEGYHAIGDGTPAALFPLLSGKTELELPDSRRGSQSSTIDQKQFIFHMLKEHGYRTAYFEDSPQYGTFQYRFNGFQTQPADHYLRSFFRYIAKHRKREKCLGDTPQYLLLLNITEQFFDLDSLKFCFTFIADISHDDINLASVADDNFGQFLSNFHSKHGHDTVIIVMSDHGHRFGPIRRSLVGKFEERLPMMAIILPKSLENKLDTLKANSQVLTTPHDVHATIRDVTNLSLVQYKVPGADIPRALSLLSPIPKTRSCGEAGVEDHWCTCVSLERLDLGHPIVARLARAAVDFINEMTEKVRDKCVKRSLKTIEWVFHQRVNNGLLKYTSNLNDDLHIGMFERGTKVATESYNIKMTVGPGLAMYELQIVHSVQKDTFAISPFSVSRTNVYGNEPNCISHQYPHLNIYCFCKDSINSTSPTLYSIPSYLSDSKGREQKRRHITKGSILIIYFYNSFE